MSLAEPLLVAAGFGIYVNRRVFLEGWDIELAFRRLAARAEERGPRRRFGAAAAALLALWLGGPASARAQCVPEDVASADACIEEVLGSGDFGTQRKELRWVPRDRSESADAPDLSWAADFAAFVARAAQVLL
jgi:hypothetical protein